MKQTLNMSFGVITPFGGPRYDQGLTLQLSNLSIMYEGHGSLGPPQPFWRVFVWGQCFF